MKVFALLVVMTVPLYVGGRAVGDERLPLPSSPPPTPVIASMDKSGLLVLRMRLPDYAFTPTKKEQDAKQKDQTRNETLWREQTYRLQEAQVRAYDTNGKEVNWKSLQTLLKKETPALYCYGEKIDPLHVRNFKDGTLIFVYKPTELQESPVSEKNSQQAAKPALPVLPGLLTSHGFVAVPLQRLGSGHLVVRVQINGRKLLLGVDTGAPQTCLDRWQVRHLELKWQDDVQCDLEGMEIGQVKTEQLRIGAHDMMDTNVLCKAYNYPLIDGLLGADVLRKHSAVIDHGGAVLYLRKPEQKK
jgi:hypothetical protein